MAITGRLLEKEGIYLAESVSKQELAKLPPVKTAQIAESLSGLSNDFVFFNHGLLFTAADFAYDPVEEFLLKLDDRESVFVLEYPRPLFRGINFPNNPDDSWNKTLLGCRVDVWPSLYRLLNTIFATSSITKKVCSCFLSCAYMPDPNAWNGKLDRLNVKPSEWGDLCEKADMALAGNEAYSGAMFPEGVPFLKVYVSGVSSSDSFFYIKSGIRPTVTRGEPEPEMRTIQEAVNNVV